MIIVWMIVFGIVFEFFFWRAPVLNPGTLLGCGVAGFVGVLGFAYWHKNWTAVTVALLILLGGCIGSGMYRLDEDTRNAHNTYPAIRSGR